MNYPHFRPYEKTRPIRPQLLMLAGVFLMANLIFVPNASAKSQFMFADMAQTLSPLQENEVKIKELNKSFDSQKKKIDEANAKVDEAKKESTNIADEKKKLESEVSEFREIVKELKFKVEEKKRLEADRVVTVNKQDSNAAGNNYVPGNCTWYVKQKRPDIGNSWGNANQWYSSAQTAGFKTGKHAKTGSIGVSFEGWAGHVVYVEKWLGKGKVLISEMNYAGLYNTNTREVDESEFVYIYEL